MMECVQIFNSIQSNNYTRFKRLIELFLKILFIKNNAVKRDSQSRRGYFYRTYIIRHIYLPEDLYVDYKNNSFKSTKN